MNEAHNRIYDLLKADDGQAHKEARRYLEREAPELAAQLAAPQAPAIRAALSEGVILAVDKWFAQNTGLGGCSDKDAAELAAIFAAAPQAPAAPAVDTELLELAQAIVKYNRQHGGVLAVHIENLADLLDEREAQAKEPK